jgi:hypothetical protein
LCNSILLRSPVAGTLPENPVDGRPGDLDGIGTCACKAAMILSASGPSVSDSLGGSGRLVHKGFHYGVPSQPGSLFQHFSDALFEPRRRLNVTGIVLVV